jgi:hypothetical protein
MQTEFRALVHGEYGAAEDVLRLAECQLKSEELGWPETQHRIQALLERGLQREVDFENRWPEVLGTLVKT